MIAFKVNDMTCGHCVSMITKAVKATDKDAQVKVDLATKRVEIEPTSSDAGELKAAIQEAGYTPVEASTAAATPAAAGGSCCGTCH
jgi:copper chaperone